MTEETSRASTPLLLLHGALGSGEQLLRFSDAFREERQVFAPDLPGHGRATAGGGGEAGFSIPAFADAVRAFLDRHDLGKTDIFGYSMGGYIGLHIARHHPERVGTIMTFGTKFDWNKETAVKEASRLDPGKLESKVPAFAAQLRERHGERWKEVVRLTALMMLGLGAAPDLADSDIRSIPHRVLVGVGDRDAMVSTDETLRTARALPAGECLVLPGTPHPFEQVDREILAYHARHFFSRGQSA